MASWERPASVKAAFTLTAVPLAAVLASSAAAATIFGSGVAGDALSGGELRRCKS